VWVAWGVDHRGSAGVRFDLRVSVPEELSREELVGQLAARDRQVAGMAVQLAQLLEANEALAAKLAQLEHLLSRNSGNSSNPPSRDDDPGRTPPPQRQRGGAGPARSRGKQPGAPGSQLAWTDAPNQRRDRFPQGCCGCGGDLGAARDLGIVDRYQQHEIP
jgi:transposase